MARVVPDSPPRKKKTSPKKTSTVTTRAATCTLDFNVRLRGKGIRLTPARVAKICAWALAGAIAAGYARELATNTIRGTIVPMSDDKYEDIGWPTLEEESALDRAAEAARPALLGQTTEDHVELARRCLAAERYRLTRDQRWPMRRRTIS
jgi:hypothetical protein